MNSVVSILVLTLFLSILSNTIAQKSWDMIVDAEETIETVDFETILMSDESVFSVKSSSDVLTQDLSIEVIEGSTLELDKALLSGEVQIDISTGPSLNPNITALELLSPKKKDSTSGGNNIRGLQRFHCPQHWDSGISNDVALTIKGLFFKIRITCGEKCCARMWECRKRTCIITCSKFAVKVTTKPFLSCCNISGRETVIPDGPCFNDPSLCSA